MDYITDIPDAPKAVGPYSPAVKVNAASGELVFLSGQIGINPRTSKLVEGGFEAETRQVLANIQAVLKHLSLDFGNIIKTTIFVTDLGNYQKINELYGEAMGVFRPARSTVQVAALPLGASVEIEVIASTSPI